MGGDRPRRVANGREVGRILRNGGQFLPFTDLVIAVAAVRSGAALWSRDEDFRRIAEAFRFSSSSLLSGEAVPGHSRSSSASKLGAITVLAV